MGVEETPRCCCFLQIPLLEEARVGGVVSRISRRRGRMAQEAVVVVWEGGLRLRRQMNSGKKTAVPRRREWEWEWHSEVLPRLRKPHRHFLLRQQELRC